MTLHSLFWYLMAIFMIVPMAAFYLIGFVVDKISLGLTYVSKAFYAVFCWFSDLSDEFWDYGKFFEN